MDYNLIDYEMSCWVVTAIKNGTRFYISDNESETPTSFWANARRFRYIQTAEVFAARANAEMPGGEGCVWEPVSVAAIVGAMDCDKGN